MELARRYARLHQAAGRVWSVALPPDICKPTHKGESGEFRKIVGTPALEELRRVLYEED